MRHGLVIPACIVGAGAVLSAAIVSHAGPLNPPAGAVSSTYKTLSEVEPRVAVSAANTPGDGDSVFRITQAGSYYLTGNVAGVAGKSGIEIAASEVTLDLGGFAVVGGASTLDGITTFGTQGRITVMNGSVRAFAGDGVDLSSAGPYRIQGVIAASNVGYGIRTNNAQVEDCSASANGGGGINGGDNSLVTRCNANGNGGDNIVVGQRCNVSYCVANGSTTGNGINLSFVTNIASNCTANGNFLNGIFAQQRSKVFDCICRDNVQNGVRINFVGSVSRCYCDGNQVCGILCDGGGGIEIVNNSCNSNGNATTLGAGIRTAFGGCRIDSNSLEINYRSMDVLSSGNVVSRNVSGYTGAGGHYNIVGGNAYGPLVVIAGVGDISGTANANHPMANYQH